MNNKKWDLVPLFHDGFKREVRHEEILVARERQFQYSPDMAFRRAGRPPPRLTRFPANDSVPRVGKTTRGAESDHFKFRHD